MLRAVILYFFSSCNCWSAKSAGRLAARALNGQRFVRRRGFFPVFAERPDRPGKSSRLSP